MLSAQLSLFANRIGHYIFTEKLQGVRTNGCEATVDFRPEAVATGLPEEEE